MSIAKLVTDEIEKAKDKQYDSKSNGEEKLHQGIGIGLQRGAELQQKANEKINEDTEIKIMMQARADQRQKDVEAVEKVRKESCYCDRFVPVCHVCEVINAVKKAIQGDDEKCMEALGDESKGDESKCAKQ